MCKKEGWQSEWKDFARFYWRGRRNLLAAPPNFDAVNQPTARCCWWTAARKLFLRTHIHTYLERRFLWVCVTSLSNIDKEAICEQPLSFCTAPPHHQLKMDPIEWAAPFFSIIPNAEAKKEQGSAFVSVLNYTGWQHGRDRIFLAATHKSRLRPGRFQTTQDAAMTGFLRVTSTENI